MKEFIVTRELLERLNACQGGLNDFNESFKDGVDYEKLIDFCDSNNKSGYSSWLFDHLIICALDFLPIIAGKFIKSVFDNCNKFSEDSAKNASSGDFTQNASSGDFTQTESTGKSSVTVFAGFNCKVKIGVNGCVAMAFKNENGKNCIAVGYEGQGLDVGKWYCVNSSGKFLEVIGE